MAVFDASALLAFLRVEDGGDVVERGPTAGGRIWVAPSHLSLADRLCLALAVRLEADVLTADRALADQRGVTLIR